ncbi:Pleiotropic drug resistance ABC transporter protein [Mycena kentingensis (nom. inval.)]|nr:Pleiotropic drug resistance ABC transporter protein [Mycena kentingensis (nom. inval.)]
MQVESAPTSGFLSHAQEVQIAGGNFVNAREVHLTVNQAPLDDNVNAVEEEILSDSEIYSNKLLCAKRGLPIYDPAPIRNLPSEYRRLGVMIGDVGRVTPDGVFDYFFNVYRPADDAVNAHGVHPDFRPLPIYDYRGVLDQQQQPGSYVSTPKVFRVPGRGSQEDFPGSRFIFSCNIRAGAILALPYGSQCEKLQNIKDLRQYAADNADSWYRYVNGSSRGRELQNGHLLLITGWEKTNSWGMATFRIPV